MVRTKPIGLDEIDQLETGIWMRQGLKRIRTFLEEHEAEDELIDIIENAILDNEEWIDTDLEATLPRDDGRTGSA